ncbi:hypothetical protein RDI58_007981 [Solanum bulbocastanum]|uniref:Uncharacterized protein n=1 Tax=Solanum bulbocastanum TaxID=147425 RepID=A0AAN8U174_SOLBU
MILEAKVTEKRRTQRHFEKLYVN